jgi:hypothetical protein
MDEVYDMLLEILFFFVFTLRETEEDVWLCIGSGAIQSFLPPEKV